MISILFQLLIQLLSLYKCVLDSRNRAVWTIGDFLYRLTEPALRPIRNILPSFGTIDLSPIVLIVLIQVAQALLERVFLAIVYGNLQGLLL